MDFNGLVRACQSWSRTAALELGSRIRRSRCVEAVDQHLRSADLGSPGQAAFDLLARAVTDPTPHQRHDEVDIAEVEGGVDLVVEIEARHRNGVTIPSQEVEA